MRLLATDMDTVFAVCFYNKVNDMIHMWVFPDEDTYKSKLEELSQDHIEIRFSGQARVLQQWITSQPIEIDVSSINTVIAVCFRNKLTNETYMWVYADSTSIACGYEELSSDNVQILMMGNADVKGK